MQPTRMETLHEAIARLESRGYTNAFRPTPDGELETEQGDVLHPDDLTIDETVRFEGSSNPDDEAVLFALSSQDGEIRGTFATSYGTSVEPSAARAIQGLVSKTRKAMQEDSS